ncbi:MAG: undecaprenyl-diphosphate phosphatase [Clostridia bacterium]|nr:undecaprenyl-diphosphate phosphatase [Clostridia bacterium]
MYIIEVLKSILFGIVEGITEWLPISSTGHMILLEQICSFKSVSPEFFEMFLVVIQLGAIFAVIVMFWNKLWPFKTITTQEGKKDIKLRMASINLWLKVLVGSIPAGVLGLIFDDLLDKYLYNHITVAITLIVYGVLFIVIEHVNKKRKPRVKKLTELSYKDAFLIGLFQALSLIPGTSRSGSTILGGITIGTSRRVASEFTFFLAVPAMLGASFLKILKFGFAFSAMEFVILINGMITAFTVSLLVIKFLMDFIKKHNFNIFGIYRIILGAIVLISFIVSR